MGFTSYDDLIGELTAGKQIYIPWCKQCTSTMVALQWYHLWTVGGQPGPGAAYTGTDLTFQRTTDTTAGSMAHGGNVSADTKHLLYHWALATVLNQASIMLVDMVGYYPMANQSNVQQNFINTNAPNRYIANGESGLQIMLVNGALTGGTASNLTILNYTNQDGNAGTVVTTPAVSVLTAAPAPTATLGSRCLTIGISPFLPLAAGDTGVRSLTNVTFSASNTGLHAFLLVKPLGMVSILNAAGYPGERDFVMQMPNLEQIRDGACLTLMLAPIATATTFMGGIQVAWG